MTCQCKPPAPRALRLCGHAAIVAVLFVLFCFLAGCGKTGMPVPHDESRSFFWESAEATMAGRCVAFKGKFSGAYRNFNGIRLEIATLNSPADCPGCPFVPTEITEISYSESGFDRKDGSIAFSYCPQQAKAYRWRLAAISVFNRLPHATMTDRFLVASEPEIWADEGQGEKQGR